METKEKKPAGGKRFVTFLIDRDTYELIAQRARLQYRTVSQVLRMIIRAHFQEDKESQVRRYEQRRTRTGSRNPGA